MLTLTPGSSCDVCAEEYGPHVLPNSIPCGHVLCGSCCTTIAEKTAPKQSPACPFCRENFALDAVRLIRLDFNTSGWSTPRRLPNMDANPPDLDAWNKRLMAADGSRSRLDARRLEAKVAKVAAKKCSVEEVTHLHKELQEWLMSDPKDDEESRSQISSLTLSAALLRAILMNHVAHSEASRVAKSIEANLKTKLDDAELVNSKLDAELKRQVSQRVAYTQKAQECQSLRQELGRLKIVPTTQPAPPPSLEMRHRSPSPPPMSSVPTTYTSSASSAARLGSSHTRSSSLFSTPAAPHLARAQTPGPVSPPRPYTPAPPRSQTPGPTRTNSLSFASANAARLEKSPSRAQTPAPPSRASTMTPTPTRHVSMTAASAPLRARTPAPVQAPVPVPRARRLSHPSPPPIAARSLSEEKYEAHQRWLPNATAYEEKLGKYSRPPSRAGPQYTFRGYRVQVEEEDDD
ncbi:RING-type domain-containing protein [Mycena chlorophos]|uniref:RING-type domain-containing protein n=1 Tax=Mycena chlorophos TaxID=658473 RepID=A0A8H6WER6_MYCCL|nr:RING-type domain-containing protein [Mycena chlorophos]